MRILSFDVGIKNLSYALLETDVFGPEGSLKTKIVDWGILNLQDDGKKHDFAEISENLVKVLHDTFSEEYEVVLIENQPAMKNPVMKSIQMLLYSYFLIKTYQEGSGTKVKFVSASSKLKLSHTCDLTHIVSKNKYRRNKQTSIAYCRNYLELSKDINGRWIDLYDKSKKKDDLCDCYGLAIHFIETKK